MTDTPTPVPAAAEVTPKMQAALLVCNMVRSDVLQYLTATPEAVRDIWRHMVRASDLLALVDAQADELVRTGRERDEAFGNRASVQAVLASANDRIQSLERELAPPPTAKEG